jgi:hypothetical protein
MLAVALLTAASCAWADTFDLGPFGRLVLDLPSGWTAVRQGSDEPGGVAFRVEPPSGTPLVLLMTPLPLPESRDPVESARDLVGKQIIDHLRPSAEETTFPVSTLEGRQTRVFYVSATDKTVTLPSATEFKFVDQGAASIGHMLLTFTLLTNDKNGLARAAAREIVRTATLGPPAPPQQNDRGTVRLFAPA